MNKIYKTIHRMFSGEVIVVSEYAKSLGKVSSTTNKVESSIPFHHNRLAIQEKTSPCHHLSLLIVGAILIGSPLLAQAGETITYPGTSLGTDYFGGIDSLFSASSLTDNRVRCVKYQ